MVARKETVSEDVFAGVGEGWRQRRMDLGEAEQLKSVVKNGPTMRKCYRRVVVETPQESVTIESTEPRYIGGARTTECFWIEVKKKIHIAFNVRLAAKGENASGTSHA
jgi:hypothetical protein